MPDFLSRLAGRALGVLPRAEPVIPVSFAPAPHVVEPARPQGLEAALQAPVSTLESVEEAVAETPERVSDSAAAISLDRPPTHEDRRTGEFPPDLALAGPAAPTLAVRAAKEAPPQVPQPGLRRSEPARTDPPARPLHAVPALQAIPEAPGLPAPAAPPLLQPGRRQPRVEQPAAQGLAPVRITIGRVEVRALLPPAAAESRPRPDTPKGVLTLEEYTRQRRRGER